MILHMSKKYYSLTLEGEFLSAFYLNLHVFLVADTENVTIEAKCCRIFKKCTLARIHSHKWHTF